MSIDLTDMNRNQLEAVNWNEGPLLVLAGPGSGKTRVLSYRVARLLTDSPHARFRVLGVTFTNKAAREMRSRVDSLFPHAGPRAKLCTFHSLAADIIRQHGSHLGIRPDFTIVVDLEERKQILTEVLKTLDEVLIQKLPPPAQLIPVIDRLLDECVPASAEFVRQVGGVVNPDQVARAYSSYRLALKTLNQLDFGSILACAVELLESNPSVSKLLRSTYTHVCIDECQDTNSAQFRLLLQLLPDSNPNLFIVADDDHLIYQWNGASPDRLIALQKQFDIPILQLPENYRCPHDVVDLANRLIAYNGDRHQGRHPLTSNKTIELEDAVSLNRYDDFREESRQLVDEMLSKSPGSRENTVVLSRRRKLLEDIAQDFDSANVPYHFASRKTEFQSAPFRFLHAALRLANNPQNTIQLGKILGSTVELGGPKILPDEIIANAGMRETGLLRAWLERMDETSFFKDEQLDRVSASMWGLIDRLEYHEFIDYALNWLESTQSTGLNHGEEQATEFESELAVWRTIVDEIAADQPLTALSLYGFLQELDLRSKEPNPPEGSVRLMTIASSKGMEFHHVYLVGLVESELPNYYAVQSGPDTNLMREERRNCFVAITRPRNTLTLSYSGRYNNWRRSPSRFLTEMGFTV